MGILNVTPDSFSDGGKFLSIDKAVDRAYEMVMEGAALIDIGGESTRPGAQPVTEAEELERVLPVIEILSKALQIPISIDTSKPQVMTEAVKCGAGFINDVRALQEQGAIQTAKELDVPICLMHMQGEPRSMQHEPRYKNVIEEVKSFLLERVQLCEAAGIEKTKIVIDPGIGFGKSLEHNLSILKHLSEFVALGLPVLIGVSRKSMIGALLDEPADKRLFGGIALAAAACLAGATIIRTHDVKATSDALKICQALVHSK
ncbi:MAG: dihydropteroate synthase [Gammaproteobacteria bacterium]|nr:dihydropteroate synthase [Gammaproteobacteria bacterium]